MPDKTKDGIKSHLEGNDLDLSMLGLETVPYRQIKELPKATSIDLSNNMLRIVPMEFCHLEQIVKLDLSENQLETLPKNIGSLRKLKHFDLFGNKLSDLPITFGQLKSLQWLDLKRNPLTPPLQKAAGDCLDDKQCRLAAKRVLDYMKEVESNHQRSLQKKLAEERAEEDRVKAARDKELALIREQKRKEKQARKEAAALIRLEAEERKREESENTPTSEGPLDYNEPKTPAAAESGSCLKCLLVGAVLLAIVAMVAAWAVQEYDYYDEIEAGLLHIRKAVGLPPPSLLSDTKGA